jgi:hypothetical protein
MTSKELRFEKYLLACRVKPVEHAKIKHYPKKTKVCYSEDLEITAVALHFSDCSTHLN